MDGALIKYRVAAVKTPNSAQLWNNVGMCFFGKRKYIASIACLKRALYLDPFEWIVAYNLGLVHLTTGQCASAFHFFSSSINLKPDFPAAYMYLAVTLARLDDFETCAAYERAAEIDGGADFTIRLNYAITLTTAATSERSRSSSRSSRSVARGGRGEQGGGPGRGDAGGDASAGSRGVGYLSGCNF